MAETANKKVLVIDTRDEENRRKSETTGLQKLCQDIRSSNVSKYISRTIMAVHDPDSGSICQIPQKDIRNYSMIEVFGDKLDMNTKIVTAFLTSHKYKVIGNKVFKNKEYPVCKLIVKFQ